MCANRVLGFWQERAVIAIDLLNNEEQKLKCALQVLKVSPVPWSDSVNPLIKLGRSSSHPIANDIFIEYKSQSVKMIKVKYGWQNAFLNLYSDKIKLVFRILKLELPEMVEDIEILVESNSDIAKDAYFYLINKLTELGELERVMEVVQKFKEDIKKCLIEGTIYKFLKMIDDGTIQGDQLEKYLEVIKLLENQHKANANEVDYKNVKIAVQEIRKVLLLREKYKFTVTQNTLKDKSLKEKYFQDGINIIAKDLKNKKGNILSSIWCDIKLLTDCFELSFISGLYQLCLNVDNLHFTCGVVDYINENYEVSVNDHEFVMKFGVFVLAQQCKYFDKNGESKNNLFLQSIINLHFCSYRNGYSVRSSLISFDCSAIEWDLDRF